MTKVLIADELSPRAIEIFNNRGLQADVRVGLKKAELIERIGEYEGLAVRSATKVTPEVLAAATRLKVIGRAGIGVDNIDVPAATARGIVVMNTPFGNSITTAEHAIALLFAAARQIAAADASTQAGRWEKNRLGECVMAALKTQHFDVAYMRKLAQTRLDRFRHRLVDADERNGVFPGGLAPQMERRDIDVRLLDCRGGFLMARLHNRCHADIFLHGSVRLRYRGPVVRDFRSDVGYLCRVCRIASLIPIDDVLDGIEPFGKRACPLRGFVDAPNHGCRDRCADAGDDGSGRHQPHAVREVGI